MQLQTVLLILFGVLAIANEIYSQKNSDSSSAVSENSQVLQKRQRSDVQRPARQQRPPQNGFGGLLSGKFSLIECLPLCFTISKVLNTTWELEEQIRFENMENILLNNLTQLYDFIRQ